MRRIALAMSLWASVTACGQDSLPPLRDGKAPATLDELWGDYDPRIEPLDTQVVREWQDGEATFRYVVFTIGTFKGRTSRMAAFYGWPRSGTKSPAIMHVHGGGQRAMVDAVKHATDNGYAGLSINWGGNEMEGMKEGDPNTDWGAIDATQRHNDHYAGGAPDPKTLDGVESPRNNNWFLLVLAARRGLTFLEQQSEVDAERLGVTGHSMGGKITVDVAGIDRRVKAAVPSCGGAGSVTGKLSGMPGSGLGNTNTGMFETIDDNAYIPRITCPILFVAPTNDFAGPFDAMTESWKKIGSRSVAYAIAPHMNHRGIAETGICGILWFDRHLKDAFDFPATPDLSVTLQADDGIPTAVVTPDRPEDVIGVDIYYSVDPHCLSRFWRDAGATRSGNAWRARCPVMSPNQPLYVYANVRYPLTTQRIGDRGAKPPETFIISSREAIYLPDDLRAAGVKETDTPSRLIDDFARGWHDWYRLEWANPHHWVAATRKLKDPKWRGPAGATLVVDVLCPADNVLAVTADLNGWGAYPGRPGGTYSARKAIHGSADWQTVRITLDDMKPAKPDQPPLSNWDTVTELKFSRSAAYEKGGKEEAFGTDAVGWREPRLFRNLRWEGGTIVPAADLPAGTNDAAPANLDETIQSEIRKSLAPADR